LAGGLKKEKKKAMVAKNVNWATSKGSWGREIPTPERESKAKGEGKPGEKPHI